jgi:hypothetical protein
MGRGVFNGAVRESQAIADPEALKTRPPREVGIG